MRYGLVILLLLVWSFGGEAQAGRRCGRTFQTLQSSYGWGNSCLSCHRPHGAKTVRANDWREALGRVAYWKQENDAFNAALGKLLGAVGGSAGNAYGQVHTRYAEQGATQYHYGQLSSFGALDIGALYDKADRLTAQAQVLAGQADADFKDLVQTAASGSARVAEILARGQAASAALAATAAGQPQPLTRTFTFQITQNPDGQMSVVPQGQPEAAPQLTPETVIANRCLSCHSGHEPQGGLDLGRLRELDEPTFRATWAKILERVKSPDPEQRMPRGRGGPGRPLSPQELEMLESVE